ncbi:MAG: hypothetical protein Q8Q07_01675 [Dehalococcoidales bacterium]|nr:hypothetical protein [Dehalococcoidales bacterium]
MNLRYDYKQAIKWRPIPPAPSLESDYGQGNALRLPYLWPYPLSKKTGFIAGIIMQWKLLVIVALISMKLKEADVP